VSTALSLLANRVVHLTVRLSCAMAVNDKQKKTVMSQSALSERQFNDN
jgi:hypothetical protein